MKKSKKKGFKLPKYKDGAEFGKNLGNTGLFIADTMLAEWAPNAIKQDQYSNTKYGKTLGDVASVHESFDSQSPISKNVSKHWDDGKTGMTEDQQKLYGQAQPFAKTGSKIGEMWTGSAMGGVGGNGATGQMIQGATKQGLNTQYDPQNPYFKHGGAFNLMHPLNNPNFNMPMFPMGGNAYQYPEGGKFTRRLQSINRPELSNDQIVEAVKYLHANPNPEDTNYEEKLMSQLNPVDQGRVHSLYQSPQGNALRPKESNLNFLMPDKYGRYVDSGVNPFDAILPGIMSKAANVATRMNDSRIVNNAIPKVQEAASIMSKNDKAVMQAQEAARKYAKNLDLKKGLVKQDQEFRKKYDWYYPKNSKSNSNNTSKFPMGGNVTPGTANAQLEKEENTLNPDGTTTQFNLPTHENQDPNEGTILAPGTLIFSDRLEPKFSDRLEPKFSDRLKPKGSKITFAILNKSNNTDKEDKILDNTASDTLAKKTAQLMKDAKHKQSLKLFQEQEMLKQSKANSYIKRLGGVMQFSEGGPLIPNKAYPTVADQMASKGLINPSTAACYNTLNYTSKFNDDNTMRYNPGLLNAGGSPNIGKTLQPFTYTVGQTGPDGRPISYNDAFNNYLSTQTDAYGKPLKQKFGGMMNYYSTGGYGPKTYNEANQYQTNNSAMPFIGNPSNRGMEFIGNPNYYNTSNTSQTRLQEMNSSEPELLHPNQFGYANFKDWNDLNQAEFGVNNNSSTTPPPTNTGMNWKDMAYEVGMWGANNAGELAYLVDQGKKYDTQKEYTYKPTLLDPTARLRDAGNMDRIARYDLADKSSGNSNNYLSNRTNLAVEMALARDKIGREYSNANAGISNDAQMANIKSKYMVDDINARNKGAADNQYYKSIERMGTNTAQAGKDNKASQMDQKTLDMMGAMFANYKYDPKTNSWIFKK